jgi:hypothetical protein
MKLEEAKIRLGQSLADAANSLGLDFSGQPKNPSGALIKYRDTVLESDSPILFKNYISEFVNNLRGMNKLDRSSERSRVLLQGCIALAGQISEQLDVDLATQLGCNQLKTKEPSNTSQGMNLDPKTFAIARAVIGVLTDKHLFRKELFSTIEEASMMPSSEEGMNWKLRSESFLRQLPIDRECEVLRVAGSHDSVRYRWSDVIDSYVANDREWFNDEFVIPTDASWLLFFFHHDILTFGVRTVPR